VAARLLARSGVDGAVGVAAEAVSAVSRRRLVAVVILLIPTEEALLSISISPCSLKSDTIIGNSSSTSVASFIVDAVRFEDDAAVLLLLRPLERGVVVVWRPLRDEEGVFLTKTAALLLLLLFGVDGTGLGSLL